MQKPEQPWRHQYHEVQKDAHFLTGHVTIKSKHCVQVLVNMSAMITASCLLVAQNSKGIGQEMNQTKIIYVCL